MSSILVTGANKGLGRESARQLRGLGHDVWVGARDLQRGQEAAEAIGARFVQLDVTDDASVAAAAEQVAAATGGALDVLVNNAGVRGDATTPVAEVTAADVEAVYAVDVLGPVRVLHAFLPLLQRSSAGVVVNVTSGLGSHAVTSDPGRGESFVRMPAYSSAKAALNMLTSQWAAALPEMKINCVDPGYTATDFTDNLGPQGVEEGAQVIVAMATVGPDGPTGTFSDRNGPLGW